MVTNDEFLTALFAEDTPWVHVTDFPYDPNNIPKDRHLAAWKGDYYSRYKLTPGYNQYFTISNFYCDETQQARRRKSLFRHTRVIVLDDVREKLVLEQVQKLPRPAWILETSPGSEQWGYILNTPCMDRAKVENLLDGLVANGLAPDGRDPGMKGVTRYVRLPEGANSKASKLIDGHPYPCRMLLWEPFNRVTLEQLAVPFAVDLQAPRREARLDGAADIEDHPLLNIPNIIKVKEVRSDGRFDITCPWVNEHTLHDDSGTAIFTNADGSIGFKCHHGACQGRTGRDLLAYIEGEQPGFSETLKHWQILREFATVASPQSDQPVSFLQSPLQTPSTSTPVTPDFLTPVSPVDAIKLLCDELYRINNRTPEARTLAASILKHVDSLPKLEQLPYHTQVCDLMGWNKNDFKSVLKDLRVQWYGERVSAATFYDDVFYVKELNQFYDWKARIFFTVEAFQNSFSHIDVEAKKIALEDGRVKKVDRLDYAPKNTRIFQDKGAVVGNTWNDINHTETVPGDITRWHEHFNVLGWDKYRRHVMQWMAFTLRHPEKKINHMLLLGSGEGAGKDFILYPLAKIMEESYTVISGEELVRDFDDYLLSTKYLHINEAELGDRNEAIAVSNKLKPIAAAPPEKLRVNPKGVKPIKVRNIISATMTTNSLLPLRLNGPSRRIFGLWSDLDIRDADDNVTPGWKEYWNDRWDWMKADGWKHVAYHLMYVVDLSDFNPEAAPPMTDFLRDIREASKSPMLLTLEAFIKKQHGAFKADLLTPGDMCETLRVGAIFSPEDMYTDGKYFTPIKVGLLMKEGRYKLLKGYYLGSRFRLYVLRNSRKYEAMDSNTLFQEYERQLAEIRATPENRIRIVK